MIDVRRNLAQDFTLWAIGAPVLYVPLMVGLLMLVGPGERDVDPVTTVEAVQPEELDGGARLSDHCGGGSLSTS